MSRRASADRKPAPITRRSVTEVSHTFKVITPIFGGGPVSKESDPVTPIRTAGLKGQFRFWWRAARAGGKDLQKLREEEARLWGGPNEEGVLSIFLQGQPQVEKEEWFQLNRKGTREEPKDGFKILAYAGFPLQRTSDEVKLRAPVRTVARCTGECTVTVKIDKKNPEYKKGDEEEAEAALWAWSLFGGVGGRTRRGFGAVSCEVEDLKNALKSKYIIDEKAPDGVPSLAPSQGAKLVLLAGKNDALGAWKKAVGKLQLFRQGLNVGRNRPASGGFAGRSRWPEPDVIRHDLSGPYQGDPKHKERITSVDKVPRGQFGMPIIFHFIEKQLGDATLKPAGAERYASPLILKAIGCSDGYFPTALLLGNRPDLDALKVGKKVGCVLEYNRDAFPKSVYLTEKEAAAIRPMHKGSNIHSGFLCEEVPEDPLLAFLAFFEQR